MKNIIKIRAFVAICVIFVLSLAMLNTANATNITVDWDKVTNVTTTSKGTLGTTEFELTVDSSGVSVYGYCIDPSQSINKGNYDFTLSLLSDQGAKAPLYYKAAWLLDSYAPAGNDVSNKKEKSAAIQGVLWTLLNNPGYALTNTGLIGSYFSTYWAAVSAVTLNSSTINYLNTHFLVARNSKIQDLLVSDPNPVPEPATMLLFGTGICLLSRIRRKNRS